jgi:geranylgeranyl diphosphate synthase type I
MTEKPVQQLLRHYKQLIDQDIKIYSQDLLAQTKLEYGEFSHDALETYCSILERGGKRLRGALVISTYEMCGGQNQQVALRAARVVETIHTYLLLIDDIADRSTLRRGGPTAHVMLQQYHARHNLTGDAEHFGRSETMTVAMLGVNLAELQLDLLDVPPEIRRDVMRSLHTNLIQTIHGQLQDIYNEVASDITEQDATRVARLKTAYYSFINPMEVGALLAGANEDSLATIRSFGLHAGLAFQLADDITGLFGTEADTGKLAMDDIKEGKMTMLVIKALQVATKADQQHLKAALGNQNLAEPDFRSCLEIIESTGALDTVKSLARHHITEALSALDNSPTSWSTDRLFFLRHLAESIVEQ